jgi:hypothetical protein
VCRWPGHEADEGVRFRSLQETFEATQPVVPQWDHVAYLSYPILTTDGMAEASLYVLGISIKKPFKLNEHH